MVKNPPANAGDTGSIPDPGRSHLQLIAGGATNLRVFIDRDGEKKAFFFFFFQLITAHHVPGDVLICSSNETTPGTAAAGEVPFSEGPLSCCSGQLASAEAGWESCRRMWGNCHPCIFQVVDG